MLNPGNNQAPIEPSGIVDLKDKQAPDLRECDEAALRFLGRLLQSEKLGREIGNEMVFIKNFQELIQVLYSCVSFEETKEDERLRTIHWTRLFKYYAVKSIRGSTIDTLGLLQKLEKLKEYYIDLFNRMTADIEITQNHAHDVLFAHLFSLSELTPSKG